MRARRVKSLLANPDLSERVVAGATLIEPARETFYGGGDEGYNDYPSLEAERLLAELAERVAHEGASAMPDVEPLGATTPLVQWPLAWAVDRLRADLSAAAKQPSA